MDRGYFHSTPLFALIPPTIGIIMQYRIKTISPRNKSGANIASMSAIKNNKMPDDNPIIIWLIIQLRTILPCLST
jgi:hypothetical protein